MIDKETLSLPDGISICNPLQGTFHHRQKGEIEFKEFVKKTYNELYRIETNTLGGRSSISVFCRFDIGLLFDKFHSADYFINEVERTPTASLWSNTSGNGRNHSLIESLGSTFAYVFYDYLTEVFKPAIISKLLD
jgi:hypothetical protein